MSWFKKPKYATLPAPKSRGRIPEGMWVKCPSCLELTTNKVWDDNLSVCVKCGFHERINARTRLEQLLDENSFQELDQQLTSADPLNFVDLKPYRERIAAAQSKTGERDAVISGMGKIQGHPLSIAVMDFQFNGGSMGSVVGEKITRSMERGLKQRVPVLTVCASGGARMQEGMFSLMQMAKTSALIARLGEAGVPYFILLTDPTMAGVMASFAMLGDVIVAEPDALIGFAGSRVIEGTIKQMLPPGFQRSDFVQEHGFIDIVAQRSELRDTFGTLVRLLAPQPLKNAPRRSVTRVAAETI
jgi:acetyl-CoA carboxylase carboxyl transferase subunit beta